MITKKSMIDYEQLKKRVAGDNGPASWRSLDELADTPEFQQRLKQEFPSQEDKWIDPVSRRSFLKVMGASLALTGLAGCNGFSKPREKILPYTNQPEVMVLGKPLYFASAVPFMGYGFPVLVESHTGRPTKIEGNPEHPDSLGAAHAFVQASVLDMYDPDRAQAVTYLQELRDWVDFSIELNNKISELGSTGEGFALVTGTVTSPTLGSMLSRLQEKYPAMRWVQYDAVGRDNVREGARRAFGEYVETQYRFENADVVVSLDADFMLDGPAAVRHSKAFASRRRATDLEKIPCRYYAVEASPTTSGVLADHKLLLKPSLIEAFAQNLAVAVGAAGVTASEVAGLAPHQEYIDKVAADLKAAGGKALVVPGEESSPTIHALAHAINSALGAAGNTVVYTDPVEVRPTNQLQELTELVEAMNAGQVKAIVMMDVNPVYTAPADLNFEAAFRKVAWRAAHGHYMDETAELCQWHVPAPHYLETWGDVRSSDGTVSIVQPLIAPLYSSRTDHEMIQHLLGESGKTSFDIVQEYWKQRAGEGGFEKFWRRIIHDGFIADTAAPARQVTLNPVADAFAPTPGIGGEIEIAIRREPALQDGRFANNAWLQELPRPFSKLTWDNAAYMSLQMAHKLGVQFEDVVTIDANGKRVEAPVYVVMGHAPDCITLHLGYGRRRGGRVAMDDYENEEFMTPRGATVGMPTKVGTKPRGVDAYQLWKSDVARIGSPIKVMVTGEKYKLASTQLHFSLDDNGVHPENYIPLVGSLFTDMAQGEFTQLTTRGLVRRGTFAELKKFEEEHSHDHDDEHHAHHGYADSLWAGHVPPNELDFYDEATKEVYAEGYGWGMAVDQSVCNGCNACVIACQAENNVPVVGKGEVRVGREMHWMRIDQYYSGSLDNPTITNQPLMCMHCDTAPCEVVCPVAATVHSPEGLNEMAYNRCVGTRFCSNNCPYKVRRFNWFFYTEHAYESPLAKMVNNPDVTVRSRGVMEKCTYCVQRINSARIEAENESRQIRDGDIVTACEATCPTDAIVFGNVNDPESRVSRLKANTLNYGLLTDMNTKPRTTYLAVITNPNPEIEEA